MKSKELRRVIRRQFGGKSIGAAFVGSGYRAMWSVVCFDLPVGTKKERRHATAFRNFLLNEGYSMKQWSVYHRYHPTRDQAEASADRIGQAVPSLGNVTIMFITDKQFGQTRNFDGAYRADTEKKPDQLVLL